MLVWVRLCGMGNYCCWLVLLGCWVNLNVVMLFLLFLNRDRLLAVVFWFMMLMMFV